MVGIAVLRNEEEEGEREVLIYPTAAVLGSGCLCKSQNDQSGDGGVRRVSSLSVNQLGRSSWKHANGPHQWMLCLKTDTRSRTGHWQISFSYALTFTQNLHRKLDSLLSPKFFTDLVFEMVFAQGGVGLSDVNAD